MSASRWSAPAKESDVNFTIQKCAIDRVIREPLSLSLHREMLKEDLQHSRIARAAGQIPATQNIAFPREELVRQLLQYAADFSPNRAVIDNIQALSDPRTVIVITGQQPGFLAGPLYTFFKAAHAIVLADEISKRSNCKVIPMFWNHGDDHDIDETRGISIYENNYEPLRLTLDLGRGKPFLSDIAVPENANEVFERFARLLPPGADREFTETLFQPRAQARFAAESSRILLELFGNKGLVVFEPFAIRGALSRALASVVCHVEPGMARLRAVSSRIRQAGFNPAFDGNDPSILFIKTATGRERIHYREGTFILPDEKKLSPYALSEQILAQPELYSAGVAVRLVCESLALPVIASIRGPAEIAYAPCSNAFFPENRKDTIPVEFPRYTATVFSEKLARNWSALAMTPDELLADSAPAAPATDPSLDPLDQAVQNIRQQTTIQLAALKDGVQSADANLVKPFEKTLSSIESSFETFTSKLRKSIVERSDVRSAQRQRLRAFALPFGKPQERSLSIAPFLTRDARGFVNNLLEAAASEPMPHHHHFLIQNDAS